MSLVEREQTAARPDDLGAAAPPLAGARRPSSAPRVGLVRLELAKLAGQTHLQVLCWLVLIAPVALVVCFAIQGSTPSDTLFGRWVHETGLAIPLVVMGFAGQWVYPALAGVVAGDIFSAEDRNGTWPLLHTRSYGRLALLLAKTLVGLVFPVVAAMALVGMSLAAGLVLVGRDPILNLSGSLVDASTGSGLVAESLLTQVPAILAMASLALLLSVVTRNSLVGVTGPVVVALVGQLVALVDQPPLLREILPSGGFTAWHGLWLDQPYLRPVVVGAVANLVLAAGFLAVASIVFLHRDVRLR